MLTVRTRIARSAINGFGVFADERIPANTLVWEHLAGFDLDLEINSLPSPAQDYVRHFGNQVDPGVYLLCGDHARFMNHSNNPNISSAVGKGYALRDIAAGEEITCDYREFDISFAEFVAKDVE